MPDGGAGERRLDAALAERGLARSRTVAARLVAGGLVSVDGATVLKASTRVRDDQRLEVAESDHYVSRAAHKLIAALDVTGVPVEGRLALDVGASTGGFTQVLLERGARTVIALDVGHGQLDPAVALDARVVAIEGVNARFLTAEGLRAESGIAEPPDLVVADLSFISLTTVLPAVTGAVDPQSDLIVLVKPQFEVGRGGVREGIVHDAAARHDAVMGVLWAAWDLGYGTAGLLSSPLPGTTGNIEYLAHLHRTLGTNPTEWIERLAGLA